MSKVLPSEIRQLFTEIGSTLNQYLSPTDSSDPAYLPEPWRSQLAEVRGQLNASLIELPDTPPAQDPGYGLIALRSSLCAFQSIITSLNGVIKAKTAETATARASITGEVDKALDAKVKAGEVVLKETAAQLATNARTEGVTEGLTKGRQISDRRLALATAGLPPEVIGAAPEDILLAEEPAFNGHRDKAKDRVTKLGGVGLSLASATALKLAWAPDEEFTAQFTTFSSIHDAAKGKTSGAPPPSPASKPSGFITPTGTTNGQKRAAVLC